MKTLCSIFCTLFISCSVWATDYFELQGVNLGLGTLSPPVDYYQTNDQGDTNTIQFNFLLKFDTYFPINQLIKYSLGAGAELPKSDEVGNKKFPFYFNARLHYIWNKSTLFVGTMLYFQNQFGPGESINMNNGSGMSEFYLPDGNRTSRNLIIEIGGDINIGRKLYLQPSFLLVNLTNNKKKNLAYLITLNYYFTPDMWRQ